MSFNRRRTGMLVITLLACLAIFRFAGADGSAQRSVEWLQYSVGLDIQSDGVVHVSEYQVIEFSGGPFSGGFAEIPLDRIDSIGNVRVSQVVNGQVESYAYLQPSTYDGDPKTYTVVQTSSDLMIDYGFDTVSNETITILLEYSVNGVIRTYPDEVPPNQQLWWTAISSEVTDIADIREASVSVRLPEPVDPAEVIAGTEMVDLEAVTEDNQIWTWTSGKMSAGDDLIVRLQFPPITTATQPTWQDRVDQQVAESEEREERSALLNLLFLAIAGLATVVGTIGLYGLWYTRGRDPYVPEAATFLAAPPDDLPAGVAGALLDEVVNDRDIIATLLDLAGRGVLKLEDVPRQGIFGSSDFALTLKAVPENGRPFEMSILRTLFGSGLELDKTVRFSSVKSGFAAAADTVRVQIYDELVSREFFNDRPEDVRERWRSGSVLAMFGVGAVSILLIKQFSETSLAVWVLPVVLFGLGLGLMLTSAYIPRKTLKGAEAAKRWEAFKRYLDDIDKYEQIANHTEIFDRYLPYVVAFGIEESWVKKFASVSTPSPTWFEPAGGYGPGRGGSRSGPVVIWNGGGSHDGGGGRERSRESWPETGGGGASGFPDLGDLQRTSDSAMRTLSSTSSSLFDMLSTAASAMSAGTGSRGGGFGGSRGGGGFSGGGSRGGSSGGGGRGFR